MNEPERSAETRRWLRWAGEELAGARALLREARSGSGPPRLACSLAQQSAEKALKAAIIYLDAEPPRIHNLRTLLGQIPADWRVRELSAELAELTSWAVEARYPADIPEATLSQAELAVIQAEQVLERVSSDIKARE